MDERANGPEPPKLDDATLPDPEQRQIPTDGLAKSLPDWVQRPPAWRGMTVREPEPRDLPPPDTSVIDPRTMLEIGDLPIWLQRIAARSMTSEAVAPHAVESGATDLPEPTLRNVPSPIEPASVPAPESRDTAAPEVAVAMREHPMTRARQQHSPTITFRSLAPERQTAWWTSRAALAALAALAVFLIVWLVLVAT